MSAAEFDIGPLTWVKGEIDQALHHATEALAARLANPLESTQLKICKNHLHQAHGALEIVGLSGVTRLTEECERLIDAVDNGEAMLDAGAARALQGAFAALRTYLDRLVQGEPHRPLRLFAAYAAVMRARGAERIAESDLFFPDLAVRLPRREMRDLPVDMRAHVIGQRRRFQAGLLRWLRNVADNAALREMTEAVRSIERTQALPQHRAFWWVTIGFTETLIAVGASAGIDAKRLCARIDLQMKRLLEGSASVAERLLRDTLFFVARSRVETAQVREIRRVYALDATMLETTDDTPTEALALDLKALREILGQAKDKWTAFSAGQTQELAGFREQAGYLRARVASLDTPDLTLLASAISSVADWVGENRESVGEALALDTATAILLAENAIEAYPRLASQFPQQVLAVGARLSARLAGRDSGLPPAPQLDEVAQRAQERLLMAQVASEIRTNLHGIESALDAFFRNPAERDDLPALDSKVRQVRGALAILGAERAVVALDESAADIARFTAADYQPAQEDFERVAQLLSGVGFFVEAMQHGEADFDAAMRPVAPPAPATVSEDDSVAPVEDAELDALAPALVPVSVEVELEQARRDTRALFDALRDKPDDAVLAAELKANLEAIAQDADLVDDPSLVINVGRALEMLEAPPGDGSADAGLDAAMAAVAPLEATTPMPSAEIVALSQAPVEVVDAELLAIFLEEAREVLASIAAHAGRIGAGAADHEALTVVRRGFHTLKGSGRMVGLARLGEAAWGVEQTMNLWLQESRPVSEDLVRMITAAHGLMDRWIDELTARGSSSCDGVDLVDACARMRAGEPFMLAPAPPPAPATPPAEEAVVTVGDLRMARALYDIFIDEAETHLGVMRAEMALLEDEPQPPRDELVRAAHTLAGIAGTVGMTAMHDLGRSFERAVLVAKSGGIAADDEERGLLLEAVERLGVMVDTVVLQTAPAPALDLQGLLDDKRADWLAASGGLEPSLMNFDTPPPELAPPEETSDPAPFVIDSPGADGEMLTVDFEFDAEHAPPPQLTEADSASEVVPEALVPPGNLPEAPTVTAEGATVDIDFSDASAPTLVFDVDTAGPLAPLEATPLGALEFAQPAVAAEPPPEAPADMPAHAFNASVAPTGPGLEVSPGVVSDTMAIGAPSDAAVTGFETAGTPPQADAPPITDDRDDAALSDAELRARGFDPTERLLERIEDDIDAQLLPVFLEEAADLVPRMSAQLRAWGGVEPVAAQALQRTLHTLKGSARMAGAMAIGQVTHSMEARIERALKQASVSPALLEGLTASADRVYLLLDELRASAVPVAPAAPAPEAGPAAAALIVAGAAQALPDELAAAEALPAAHVPPVAAPIEVPPAATAEDARASLRVRADLIDRLVNEAGEVAIARSRIEGELRAVKANIRDLTESVLRLRAQLREVEISTETQMQSRRAQSEENEQDFDPLEFDRFTRLQELTRMMAESVNDVATVQQGLLKSLDDADLALLAQSRLNRDLQNDLLRVRMVPFNTIAERLYRVVRQTAKEVGKRANLDISGLRMEIDRSVLERMAGPFEHLLRNAIVHGIEAPHLRAAAGKSELGQMQLTARQEGNEFILTFEDDGAGLDLDRIRARAVARGMAAADARLTEAEIVDFIFTPGFSTAEAVSEIAGRGIGMDVVRSEVVALGGRIDTSSVPGRGTVFTIALPLTLAVTQVVLLRAGSGLYAIPSVMVEQVQQMKSADFARIRAAGECVWQERSYPLHALPHLLGDAGYEPPAQRLTPVILLRSGNQRAAVQVDAMAGNQEVVVKNIGPQLARVTGIAGATVLGNGEIVLILNPVPLALMAASGALARATHGPSPAALAMAAPPTVMVVDDSLTVRKATTRLLARENYQVLTARDGVDALEQLQSTRPDILILDIEMPRMDGFDLTRNVRADAALARIPIIMVTSRTAEKHRAYAAEIGVNAYLGKPFNEDELLANIARLLELSPAQQAH
ncbi:MAG: Hpt domain-containing protein [Burkholderiales bacterium]|nr:Hpt domain-containing protein [Burkholderiales bacterium]